MIADTQVGQVDAMIGTAILLRRKGCKISQEDIASRWHKPASYIRLIEAGSVRPLAHELIDLTIFLNCRINDLFTAAIKDAVVHRESVFIEPR